MHKIDKKYLVYSWNVDLVSNDILCTFLISVPPQSMDHLVAKIHQFFSIVQQAAYEMDLLLDYRLVFFFCTENKKLSNKVTRSKSR